MELAARLGRAQQPRWEPRGLRRALERSPAGLRLRQPVEVSTRGKDRIRLTDGPWRDRRPRWSPDGARLAYISDREGSARIRIRGPRRAGRGRPLAGQADAHSGPTYPRTGALWNWRGRRTAHGSLSPRAWRPGPAPVSWAPPAILPRLAVQGGSRIGLFVVPAAGGSGAGRLRRVARLPRRTGLDAGWPRHPHLHGGGRPGGSAPIRRHDYPAGHGRPERVPSALARWRAHRLAGHPGQAAELRGAKALGHERRRWQPRPRAERVARSRRHVPPMEFRFAHGLLPGRRSRSYPPLCRAQRWRGAATHLHRRASARPFAGRRWQRRHRSLHRWRIPARSRFSTSTAPRKASLWRTPTRRCWTDFRPVRWRP